MIVGLLDVTLSRSSAVNYMIRLLVRRFQCVGYRTQRDR